MEKFNYYYKITITNSKTNVTENVTDLVALPFTTRQTGDESLDKATLKIVPTLNSEPYEAFSRVDFYINDLVVPKFTNYVALDVVKMENYTTRQCSHNIELLEETKLLERYVVDTLTFHNPLERYYNSNALANWDTVEHSFSQFRDYTDNKDYNWEAPLIKQINSQTLLVPLNWGYVNGQKHSISAKAFSYLKSVTVSIIDEVGKRTIIDVPHDYQDCDQYVTFDILYPGELSLAINFVVWNDNTPSSRSDFTASTYIYVSDKLTTYTKPKWTITNVINRVLALTPLRLDNEQPKFVLDPQIAKEYENIEAPEFSFAARNLYEVMKEIAGYVHCLPRLKGNVITFEKLCEDKEFKIEEPFYYYENVSGVSLYATNIDTNVDNIMCLNNSLVGAIIEPYADGYKTTRAEDGQIEISEDTVIIKTQFPIYQLLSLEMGSVDNNEVGELIEYCYENAEYINLSDTSNAYPKSRAYALKWTQGQKNISELAHMVKVSGNDNINSLIVNPALSNIVNSKCGASVGATISKTIKNMFNGTDDDKGNYANLRFRVKYIPIVSARIKQFKENFKNFNVDSSITYNQSAQMVDGEFYGEHLKGVIAKMGNNDLVKAYVFEDYSKIPPIGALVDGYYVYDIYNEYFNNQIFSVISFVKDYNKLSSYIGIKGQLRMYDVSEKQSVQRFTNIDEFCVISDNIMENNDGHITSYGNTNDNTQITEMEIQGTTVNGEKLTKISLPLVSLSMGNSVYFMASFEDNYAAGYSSEEAPAKAVSIFGNQYKRSQKAVAYSDIYGEIEDLSIQLCSKGSAFMEEQSIVNGHKLPAVNYEVPKSRIFFDIPKLKILKNGGECLQIAYQLHYITDNDNYIIGSGISNFNGWVGALANQVALYGFNRKIGRYERHLNIDEATKICEMDNIAYSSEKYKQYFIPEITENFKSIAILGKDGYGNWQLVIARNLGESSSFPRQIVLNYRRNNK